MKDFDFGELERRVLACANAEQVADVRKQLLEEAATPEERHRIKSMFFGYFYHPRTPSRAEASGLRLDSDPSPDTLRERSSQE
ncbi:MAG: hypothetical protein GF334_08750 [Candidatus Altiarchaeales archaeon]|nr:hypothetical protein [Candidatus Altiarchaeales archaeon]